jgi:hypothetical protein
MNKFRFTMTAFLGLIFVSGSAFADEMFYLTVPENGCTLCAPADTVLVDVDLTATGAGVSTATVTFTGQTVGGNAYTLYAINFEVNGSYGVSEDKVTVGGVTTDTLSPGTGGPNSLDNYGSFSDALTVHDASSVVFYLDGGTWTSAANVLAPTTGYNHADYAQGFDAAGQVRVGVCTSTTQPGCTAADITSNPPDGTQMDSAGFEPAAVPEPTSMLLFGSVLLLVAGTLHRKR